MTSYDTYDNDILINDCTKVSKIALDFDKSKDTAYSDIKSVINEYSLYTRVKIKGKITDVSVATENDVGFTMVALKTAIIHDESRFSPLTIFGDICDAVKDEKYYDICNLSLSKFKSDRILKTTEITKLKEIDDLDLNLEGREIGQNIIRNGKIIFVNSKSLNVKYKCPECKNEILIEKDFVICNNCDIFTVKSFCIKDDKVRRVFQSDVKEQFTLMIPLLLLQEIEKQSIHNKSLFLHSLMTQPVIAQHDPNDMVVKLFTNIEE